MLARFIGAALLTLFCLWPAQLDAFVAQSMGCHHNGTWYADRSLVPTMEKCLTCQCQKKTLVCRLKVCPEMPMPPPRGCIVVQQRNSCCPYLSCARLDAFYKIPATRRIIAYLDHYERESIDRVVNDNMLQRRSDDSEVDMYVCVKNGTVYKSGSAMSSSNLCTYCYCIGGTEKCVKPKCMLPVEGCKPIFVDSTCCPVRYDCTSKPSGKSSQEVRYRKTSNKHYLRMSQRLQRNRGCTVDKQFYVEGQKMRSDADKPCDICFCIRGVRRCAPKKCSPALKNCIPVVPKGQCCPSSYDCGSQRAQSSRQFNLFSLLFGKEDEVNGTNDTNKIPAEYPPDRHPSVTVTHNQNILEKNNEKSILDTIREGLEIIDGNNEEVIAQNIDKLAAPLTRVVTEAQISSQATEADNVGTEVSFLDLLLGSDEEEDPTKVTSEVAPELKTTTGYEGLSWVDILLGPEEHNQKTDSTPKGERIGTAETTLRYQYEPSLASIDRIDQDFADFSGNGEIIVGDPQSSESLERPIGKYTEQENNGIGNESFKVLHNVKQINNVVLGHLKEEEAAVDAVESATTAAITKTTTTTTSTTTKTPEPVEPNKPTITTKTTQRPNSKAPISTSSKPLPTPASTQKPTHKPIELKFKPKSTQKPSETVMKTTTTRPQNETQTTMQTIQEKKKNGLLTVLLDGLSDMLSPENLYNNTQTQISSKMNSTTTTTTTQSLKDPLILPTPKPKPLPSFKPLPTGKPLHMRINSKIANLTTTPELIKPSVAPSVAVFKPLPVEMVKLPIAVTTTITDPGSTTKVPQPSSTFSTTPAPRTTTTPQPEPTTGSTPTSSTTTTTTQSTSTSAAPRHPSTTLKPVVINTNPTILESEPIDANAEPTLPPSLPNLKIIPFLPTDAVKADRNKPLYDFYHSNAPTAKIDYDQYDEGNIYPAITEPHFPIYPDLEDGSKAEYIYKFNVEGPSPPVTSSTAGKLEGVNGVAEAFVKYDFADSEVKHKGFSPPTKTEGGFVPKDPLVLGDDGRQVDPLPSYSDAVYQVTKHIIDITTSGPLKENTTKVIEITTPDPFKDVIRTEPPPDLTFLIGDKEITLMQKHAQLQPPQAFEDPEQLSQSVIHITTAAPQSFSPIDDQHPPQAPIIDAHSEQNTSAQPSDGKKDTIATFLDLLLGGDEPDSLRTLPTANFTVDSSTVPPFKTLPKTPVKLLPNSTATTTTMVKPKRVTTKASRATAKPTASKNYTTSVSAMPTRVITTATAASNATKSKPKPKTPTSHKAADVSPTVGTKALASTRPKSTRPKSSSARRQTTRTPTAAAGNQRRDNSTTNVSSTTSTPATPTSTTTQRSAPTTKPLLRSPFDTLPFMDTSFEVKRTTQHPFVVGQQTSEDFLDLLQYKNSLNEFEGLEPARRSNVHSLPHADRNKADTSTTTTTTTTTSAPPLVQRNIEKLISTASSPAPVLDAHAATSPLEVQRNTASNSLIDPTGVLKLAGCNIYGRMYRVGRIILELSSPCLECKCTEVGVKCGQLAC